MSALPEVFEAELDADSLAAVLSDIELCTQVLEVRLKRQGTSHADEAPTSLSDAGLALRSGHALGLQVRYEHKGQEWWDTVLRVGDGYKLVRTRPDFSGMT